MSADILSRLAAGQPSTATINDAIAEIMRLRRFRDSTIVTFREITSRVEELDANLVATQRRCNELLDESRACRRMLVSAGLLDQDGNPTLLFNSPGGT